MKKCIQILYDYLDTHAVVILYILVSFTAVIYATLSVVRHMHFQSGGFDLGIYDQAVWQYAHFLFPYNTIKMRMILGDHLTLTLPLLSPLFWVWDDVRSLLIFQAVWIAFSAVPIFLYVHLRKLSKFESLVLSLLYLFFYGIQFGVFFDFHPVLLGVGILCWILYFWESKKWKWFTVSVILLLLTQENMGLALFALSITWFFQGRQRKLALMLGGVGLIASFLAFKTIPFFSNVGLEYIPHLPKQPINWVTSFFDAPEKRQVLLYTFSWYSFLPIFSPGALLAVLSDLAQYFLTGKDFARMWSPFMHHRAILSVYLLIGAVDVLTFLKARKVPTRLIVIGMLIVGIGINYHFHFAVNKLVKKDFWIQEQWIHDNTSMLAHVHPTASVAAQQSLVPYLSHRQYIYLIYPRKRYFPPSISVCKTNPCWWLEFAGRPDLLVVDTHNDEWLTMTLEDITNFREAIRNMEATGVIKLQYRIGEARIYRISWPTLSHIL